MSETKHVTRSFHFRVGGLAGVVTTFLAIMKVAAIGHFGAVPWIWVFFPMWLPVAVWTFWMAIIGLFALGVMGMVYLLDKPSR